MDKIKVLRIEAREKRFMVNVKLPGG